MIRFLDLEKLLAARQLPALDEWTDELSAALFRIDVAELRELRESHAAQVVAAATELIDELQLTHPPFEGAELVLGIGDSITADALSWFEILRATAEALRSTTRFVNAGIPGDTTADIYTRLEAALALAPDRVVIMVGANDCKRIGSARRRVVSAAETERNIAELHARLSTACPNGVVWLTPPLVDADAVRADPWLAAKSLTFENADLRRVADAIRRLPGRIVETQRLFEGADPALWDDGLHPTLAGQELIARELVQTALWPDAQRRARQPVRTRSRSRA